MACDKWEMRAVVIVMVCGCIGHEIGFARLHVAQHVALGVMFLGALRICLVRLGAV